MKLVREKTHSTEIRPTMSNDLRHDESGRLRKRTSIYHQLIIAVVINYNL